MRNPSEDTFVSHLIELRDRLLKSLAAVIVVFIALSPWMQEIYGLLADPILALSGKGMIATDVTSPFFAAMKATGAASVILALPVIIYQIWAFVAPGLYGRERRVVFPLIVSSYLLFLVGMAFAYFFVIPNVFKFMGKFSLNDVQHLPDITSYLSFAFTMFFAFGLAFEVPVVVVVLTYAGLVSPKKLVQARPYVIVGAFFIAAVVTPPDVLSQIMLAVPMCILYEVGLFIAKRIRPFENEGDEEDSSDDVPPLPALPEEPHNMG